MPPPARTNRSLTSGRPSTSTPMSERQQMALLLQMTTSTESESATGSDQAKNKPKLNDRGETALHIYAKKGDLEGAKKFLDQGGDPNASDFAGWTPLHEAANHGHYHIAALLVKHGANVNSMSIDDNNTPLHDAAVFGNQKIVKLLIDKGANPNFKNKKGKTPRDFAHPSLLGFFASLDNEMTNKKESQQQSQNQKKQQQTQQQPSGTESNSCSSGSKKTTADTDEGNPSSSSNQQTDVYEFVSTPKHSSCSSGDENPKQSDKSSDEKSGSDSIPSSHSTKRPLSDQQDDENENSVEDSKRKKRKESELKDTTKSVSAVNKDKNNPRTAYKPPGPASKTINVNKSAPSASTTVAAAIDRKSPSEMQAKSPENDGEGEDGPKVPPLKIVINCNNPQQSSSESQEAQNANARVTNKQVTSRNHPYIVSSMAQNESNSSEVSMRSQSPSVDSNKSDESKPKSKEPRVLRSSRKDGKDDRGSNNSSPQLPISSTPSPSNQNEVNESDSLPPTSTSAVSVATTSTGNTAPTPAQNPTTANQQQPTQSQNPVELHPRKRKIKASREPSASNSADNRDSNSKDGEKAEILHPHEQPFTNCYQMFIDLRKQIEQRHRNLRPVEPKPLKFIEDYLMSKRTYLLHGKSCTEPKIVFPTNLPTQMRELFVEQEKERNKLRLRHIVEKEKSQLSIEQEILRVHCKAAQKLANQSQPFSVSTILKDEEVYSMITPEQEEKYRNKNREKAHNRVFFQALKDIDDKHEKIKEVMIIRHTNEAESLNAVQKMDWGWRLKEFSLCEYRATPEIDDAFVPMIEVSDEVNSSTRETF